MTNLFAPTIICFGEALWDCLPRGRFLGGAPCNVAYHLRRLGAKPSVVTAVGDDALGEELVTVSAGDTVRWIVGDTASGSGSTLRVTISSD